MNYTVMQQKLAMRLQLIEPLVFRNNVPLPPFRYRVLPDAKQLPPFGKDEGVEIPYNSYWGNWTTNFVLRSTFQIPEGWEGDIALHLPLGDAQDWFNTHPEALIYLDDQPFAACDLRHQTVIIPAHLRDHQPHQLMLHGWTGLGSSLWGSKDSKLFMQPCSLVQIDPDLRTFITLARTTLEVAQMLEEQHPAKIVLFEALDQAFKILDTRQPFGVPFYESVTPAYRHLREHLQKAGTPLDADIYAAGHAHIDTAWLWTLDQSRRKAGRTFHTVLHLMDFYPEYCFTQSQPQLYEFVRQDYPALFERIQQRVAEGRWETIGGMWVEADCNISGGEALARQFVLGVRYFREYFGGSSPVLWLPDAFGYSWNLPQLAKQAGMEYFFTIKLRWNQTNEIPYDSFWWQGLDGTRLLTHFSTTPEMNTLTMPATYNAVASGTAAVASWLKLKQKNVRQMLMSYGFGDGGGGPTPEMLENIRVLNHFPAAPRVRQSRVDDFFKALERENGERLPTWNDELYLETHRGVFTTQARTKRANRKSEFLLHDAEFLASYAKLLNPDYHYPAAKLRQAWELLCLNQFHDILPGSSIREVYVDSARQYEEIRQLAESVRDEALQVLSQYISGDMLIVNPTSFTRNDPVLINGVWVDVPAIAPYSLMGFTSRPENSGSTLIVQRDLLENDHLRVELNTDGDITRIFDKAAQREILPDGALANQWEAFEDRPLRFDAWDIDAFYEDKMWFSEPAESIEVVEQGKLRGTIEIKRRILNSSYVQRISLVHNSRRIDFETTVEWREKHIFLKAAFPVNILSPYATYEIQWGNIQRPTHRNTSWDWARFEVPAQKWVDLSEGNYGVSLLNDCKYGFDIHNNVMRISLLRAPTYPDATADEGSHHFTYSLFPHTSNSWRQTVAEAYRLNDPLIVFPTQVKPQRDALPSFVSVNEPNIVIETIKYAENGSGFIVRLYDTERYRGTVTLTFCFAVAEAWRTDLHETPYQQLPVEGQTVTLTIKPYEIVTILCLELG